MSWATDKAAKTIANYRYIRFEGARILQSREMNDLQDTETLKNKYSNNAMFRDAGIVNGKATSPGSLFIK